MSSGEAAPGARRQASGKRLASGLRDAAKGFWASAVNREPGCVGCHELILPQEAKQRTGKAALPTLPLQVSRDCAQGVGWGAGGVGGEAVLRGSSANPEAHTPG